MGGTAFLAQERAQVTEAFDTVEQLEAVASGLSGEPESKLRTIVNVLLGRIPPVRATIAADLLCVAQPTVSRWARSGLLVEAEVPNSTVLHLDATHLHEVLHLLRDVRAKGAANPDFTKYLRWALQDRELAGSADVRQGLAELDRGEYVEL